MKFKAAMFDFDGTITEKGVAGPTQEMADLLVDLAHEMPIAFCTGRQLESFEKRALNFLIKEIEPGKLEAFFENLYLLAENGAVGYEFNTDLDCFKEFYRVAWPDNFAGKDELTKQLDEAVKEYGEVYYDAHRVVIVIRTKFFDIPEDIRDMEKVYGYSRKIYKICASLLREIDENFEQYLHIGDSGIGVVVGPADGDKDSAIKRFADELRVKRGFKFEKGLREILVVGDRPQKGGNDCYFLNGRYGTPFTVGDLGVKKDVPKPVLDSSGERLYHSKGTIHLLNSILKRY